MSDNDDEDSCAVLVQRYMLTKQASRCRPLDSQSIDDVMIKSSNTPPDDLMQMLAIEYFVNHRAHICITFATN